MGGVVGKIGAPKDMSLLSNIKADFTPNSQFIVVAMNHKVSIWDWVNNKQISLIEYHPKFIN